jgi:hypothetical protein
MLLKFFSIQINNNVLSFNYYLLNNKPIEEYPLGRNTSIEPFGITTIVLGIQSNNTAKGIVTQ